MSKNKNKKKNKNKSKRVIGPRSFPTFQAFTLMQKELLATQKAIWEIEAAETADQKRKTLLQEYITTAERVLLAAELCVPETTKPYHISSAETWNEPDVPVPPINENNGYAEKVPGPKKEKPLTDNQLQLLKDESIKWADSAEFKNAISQYNTPLMLPKSINVGDGGNMLLVATKKIYSSDHVDYYSFGIGYEAAGKEAWLKNDIYIKSPNSDFTLDHYYPLTNNEFVSIYPIRAREDTVLRFYHSFMKNGDLHSTSLDKKYVRVYFRDNGEVGFEKLDSST